MRHPRSFTQVVHSQCLVCPAGTVDFGKLNENRMEPECLFLDRLISQLLNKGKGAVVVVCALEGALLETWPLKVMLFPYTLNFAPHCLTSTNCMMAAATTAGGKPLDGEVSH